MNIYDLDINELILAVTEIGEEKYRAKQLFCGLHSGKKPQDITSLPKGLSEKISKTYELNPVYIVKHLKSSDGTEKFLLGLSDGNVIECVLMRYAYGNTLCISTQVGCAMGCAFCASGVDGLIRNLSAGEMVAEVLCIDALYRGKERFITNVVLMGSGEPLNNFDNTVKFLKLISCADGINISLRNISLSTCGLVDSIYKLAELKLPLTLAFSMHSPFDNIRCTIMPIAKDYTVRETVEALKVYFNATGRRIIIEYALIKDKNVSEKDAKELKRVLSGLNCHINLIRLNSVKESILQPCSNEEADSFKAMLEKEGLSVTVRRRTGADIDGACGQLRRKFKEKE